MRSSVALNDWLRMRFVALFLVATSSCSSEVPAVDRTESALVSGDVETCQVAAHGGTRATSGFSSDASEDVLVHAVSLGESEGAYQWLDTLHLSTGVQVGTRSDGKAFVVVVTADAATGESHLVSFEDNDGDDFPEQSTRTTIATVASASLAFAALHVESGTLYVVDAASNRVLRFGDLDGNRIPDSAHTVFVDSTLAPFVISNLSDAGPSTVKLVRDGGSSHDVFERSDVSTATDTTADGVADGVTDATPKKVAFLDIPVAGEVSVEVYIDVVGSYEVVALSSTATTQLATFGTQTGAQEVTLSRGPLPTERLQIRNETTAEVFVEEPALPTGLTRIHEIADPEVILVDQGSFVLRGSGVTGQEVVQAGLAASKADNWLDCTVVSTTTESIEATLPDLGLTETTSVMIRVFKNATAEHPIFVRRLLVDPN